MPNDTAKNLDPEHRDTKVDFAPGGEMKALEDRDERRQANSEGRQQEVKGDDPGELHPGQHKGIPDHGATLVPRTLRSSAP
jgi:hypothetical protein